MKIGIIGSGNMGRAVGARFQQIGHSVYFGARRAEQSKRAAQTAGDGALSGSNDEAAQFGEVLVWTIRDAMPSDVLSAPSILDGKIIIDLNNRDFAQDVREGGWFEISMAETLQKAAPKTKVVKALNTLAMETFGTSVELLRKAKAQTFIAGSDQSAKAVVADLTGQLGFEAIDLGTGPASLRAAEALGDVIRLLMIDAGLGGSAHLALTKLPSPDLSTIGQREESDYH